MKFTIELEDAQLHVLCDALENYSRMGMGQLEISVEEFLRMHFYNRYYNVKEAFDSNTTQGERVHQLITRVKRLVFEHAENSSWGIHNEEVPVACREAYDIYQMLRKARAEYRLATEKDEETRRWILATIDMRPYYPTNPDLPPVNCSPKWEDL